MTFPLRNRLKQQKDFEEVFAQGKTVKGSFFFLKILARPGKSLRFATVVPAKVAAAAVDRNRFKRRVTALVQAILTPLPQGYDIVLVVQKAVSGTDDHMSTDIRHALHVGAILP